MIRLATLEDAKGIAQVHVQSWKETYTDIMFDVVIISKSIEDRKNLWEVVLKDIHQRVWVYENDGKILCSILAIFSMYSEIFFML